LIAMGEAIGILVTVVRWRLTPHYFVLGLLILYPLGISLGSALQRKNSGVTSRREQRPL
jgi:hypothetical protein